MLTGPSTQNWEGGAITITGPCGDALLYLRNQQVSEFQRTSGLLSSADLHSQQVLLSLGPGSLYSQTDVATWPFHQSSHLAAHPWSLSKASFSGDLVWAT